MTIKQQGGIFGRNPTFNDVALEGGLSLADNKKATFGSANDLEIYSTGTTSHIRETGSGDLQISASDDVFIRGTSTNNYMARFREENSVDLYFNNVRVFQTASTGISVTGNVKVTDGGGIDFSATSGTGTSELFDDYEEGTASPQAASASGTLTTVTQSGRYTKIGRVVNYSFIVTINNVGTGSGDLNIVLPFVCSISPIRPIGFGRENALTGNGVQIRTLSDGSANASCLNVGTLANGTQVLGTITYETV